MRGRKYLYTCFSLLSRTLFFRKPLNTRLQTNNQGFSMVSRFWKIRLNIYKVKPLNMCLFSRTLLSRKARDSKLQKAGGGPARGARPPSPGLGAPRPHPSAHRLRGKARSDLIHKLGPRSSPKQPPHHLQKFRSSLFKGCLAGTTHKTPTPTFRLGRNEETMYNEYIYIYIERERERDNV